MSGRFDVRFKDNRGDVHADEVVVRAAVERFDLCASASAFSAWAVAHAPTWSHGVEGYDVNLHRGLTEMG